MALEVNFTQKDNIFVGEDKILRFYVTVDTPIKITEDVNEGDTSISVDPLFLPVNSGSTIRYGVMVLTTTANVQVGDVSIPISATTGKITKGSIGRVIQNVTGWTFTFVVKSHPEATTPILTLTPAIADAALGQVDVTIADTDTDALVPKEYVYKLWRTNAGSESVLAYGTLHLRG